MLTKEQMAVAFKAAAFDSIVKHKSYSAKSEEFDRAKKLVAKANEAWETLEKLKSDGEVFHVEQKYAIHLTEAECVTLVSILETTSKGENPWHTGKVSQELADKVIQSCLPLLQEWLRKEGVAYG